MLKVDKLTVSLPNHRNILKGISFDAKQGEIIGILGPSGVGKTTLFRAISGLLHPNDGIISLNGSNLISIPVVDRSISYMQQGFPLYKHFTVLENVLVAFDNFRDEGYSSLCAKAKIMLHNLGISENLLNRKPQKLSGGESQRVALAKSLLKPCQLLLLDEPFSNIDKATKRNLMSIILIMARTSDLIVLYVSHDENDLLLISDKIIVMHDGNIIQIGTPQELLNSPRSGKVASIGSPVGLQMLGIDDIVLINCPKHLLSSMHPQTFKVGWRPYESDIHFGEGVNIGEKELSCIICGLVQKIIEVGNQLYYEIRIDNFPTQRYIWHIENTRYNNFTSKLIGKSCQLSIDIEKLLLIDKNDNILLKGNFT